MSTESVEVRDGVEVDLSSGVQTVVNRPGVRAPVEDWVEHVVSLGVSREFVTGDTDHYDPAEEGYATSPVLTRAELVELADRLSH